MAPQRFHEQFDHIRRALPDVALAMGPYDDDAHFLYEKGVVLARDGEEARVVEDTVRAHFTRTAGLVPDHVRRDGPHTNRTGVTRIRIGDPADGTDTVPHALRALREAEGRQGRRLVSRNHVVHIAVNACPGDEPVPVARTQPANPAAAEGRHDADSPDSPVEVLVIDTGLVHDHRAYPLLAHTTGDPQPGETGADGVLRQYVGHGTFIAGILAAVAPDTRVTVRNTLSDAGAILESEFGTRLFEAVDEGGWPDIISLSAGTTTEGITDGLIGLDAFMAELREQRTLLVAAAGNNSSHAPFWPAAYAGLPEYADSVLSVGALSADGENEACFSNHGPWVRVFAPGERLTSALTGFDAPVPYVYQHSTYDSCRFDYDYSCTCQFPRHTGALSEGRESTGAKPHQVMFDGLAQWSGTSFATPAVAGLVAAHMTAYQERDPRAARDRLLASATDSAEVRGARVRVLRPPTWRPVPAGDPAVPV